VCKPSDQSGASEYDRAGYSDPMDVTVPEFTIRHMTQSSCYAEQLNWLYVTLQSSVPLTGRNPPDPDIAVTRNVTFVMSGFRGQHFPDLIGSTLELYSGWGSLFCFNGTRGAARLNATGGDIHLTLCPDQNIIAGNVYWFLIRIRNPLVWRRPATAQISMTGGVLWKPVNFTYAQGCAEPLFIDIGQPAFRSVCMNQTKPYATLNNTITLSLVPNQALAETARLFWIQSLRGAIVRGSSVTLYGHNTSAWPKNDSGVFCVRDRQYQGSWQAGDLNLTVCRGNALESYEPYVVSFDVVNAMVDQSSPSLSIRAYDASGRMLVQSQICKPSAQSGANEYARSGYADPMHVVIPEFRVRYMWQTSCTPEALNWIYVTLQSSIDLYGNAPAPSEVSSSPNPPVFVMKGLQGLQLYDDTASRGYIQLYDVWYGYYLFCVDGERGRVRFNATSGEATFVLCTDQRMHAGQNYAFRFLTINPLIWKRPPPVQISLLNGTLWKAANMTYGSGCNEPLYLDIGQPAFRSVCMNQSRPFVSSNNTLTLSLVPNQALAETVRVLSIQTLTGAIVNVSSVSLFGMNMSAWPKNDSGVFCVRERASLGSWRDGVMNFTLCRDVKGLDPYEPYVVSFNVVNPSYEQTSPSLTIRAFDAAGQLLVQTPVCRPSAQHGASEYERTYMADALAISPVGFRSRTMSQSSCTASTLSWLFVNLQPTITLKGNAPADRDVSASSLPPIWVMSGFEGIEMYDFTQGTIQLWNYGANWGFRLFCADDTPGRARFNFTSGQIELALCPDMQMRANVDYGFAIRIIQPAIWTRPPPIQISLVGGLLWRPVSFTYPNGCAQPLYIDIGKPSLKACIRQSIPYIGLNNTITVSITPNQAMAELAKMFSIRTLAGAQVQGTHVSLKRNHSSEFCLGDQPRLGSYAHGMLNISICPNVSHLTPFKTYTFSFEIQNPVTEQQSPPIMIASYDENGTVILETAMCRPSGQSGATEYERTGLLDALEVTEVGFRVRRMVQSSCRPQAVNWLYITLQSSITLNGKTLADPEVSNSKDTPVFVMSGFPSGQEIYDLDDKTKAWIQLYDIWYGYYLFCVDGVRGRARWNATSGQISLALCEDQTMRAGVSYAFMFRVKNPLIWRRPPPLQISLMGGLLWKTANMSYPDADANGNECRSPLFIELDPPEFETICINQTMRYAGLNNTLTVSLVVNQDMAEKTRIYAFQTFRGAIVQGRNVRLKSNNNETSVFCVGGEPSLAAWVNGSMNLTLCDDSEGLEPYKPYVFSIDVLNPNADQESPGILVRAISKEKRVLAQKLACKPSGQPHATENQREGFSDPMDITVPGFRISSMLQSSCLAEQVNTLSVTLQSSITFGGRTRADPEISSSVNASRFVMSGFRGLDVQRGDLAGSWVELNEIYLFNGWYWYSSLGSYLFCVDGVNRRALWNASTGEITFALCRDQTMRKGVNYAFSFRMVNPLVYKKRPPVQISLFKGVMWPTVNMTYPTGCSEPMYIDLGPPVFRTSCMNQTVRWAGINNTLTLSLVVNQAMAESARTFAIENLRGAVINTSTVTLYGPNNYSNLFCVGNQPSMAVWRDGNVNLTLCRDSEGLPPYEDVIVSFDIVNPESDQSSPAVTIKAFNGSGTFLAQKSICRPSGLSTANEYQRSGHADALAITFAGFRVARMVQSSCFVSSTNTMVFTLTSSLDLRGNVRLESLVSTLPNITFALSGFIGATLPDPTSSWIRLNEVPGGNNGHRLFCVEGQPGRGRWHAAGQNISLTLCPDQMMRAGWDYVLSFTIINPGNASKNQTVGVALAGGVAWKPVNVASPGGCASPMSLLAPRCGDGRRTEGEECDDNNNATGDGTCHVFLAFCVTGHVLPCFVPSFVCVCVRACLRVLKDAFMHEACFLTCTLRVNLEEVHHRGTILSWSSSLFYLVWWLFSISILTACLPLTPSPLTHKPLSWKIDENTCRFKAGHT
jgi:cysteine-rich repeat protein